MGSGSDSLVIAGAGHAASELGLSARQNGWAGPIVLIGDEPVAPYQRPPLSKAYLLGQAGRDELSLRAASVYETSDIRLMLGLRVVGIDRAARAVAMSDGSTLSYGKLAWCAGGRPRQLVCDGIDAAAPPANLLYLRTLADADRLRAMLRPDMRLVVVGGGYVGLEVAASARKLGADVTVVEAQPALLARVAGPAVSSFYEDAHRAAGVRILTGCGITGVVLRDDAIAAVRCGDGTSLAADLVVAGIGMIPNTEALVAAGLGSIDGIEVDDLSRTVDPDIVAAGDCTLQRHPLYARWQRIESVPNALEQARAAASWLCGKPRPNRAVPWFWSDQYDLKLQMAGLSAGFDRCIVRGRTDDRSFSAFYLQGERLLAVDAVNRPADFMLAKRLLAKPVEADADRLADESVPLNAILRHVV